jgi:ABC-type sugar transport system ATPase subunit
LDTQLEHTVTRDSEVLLEVRAGGKRFDGVHALRGVSLKIRRGSVHALVGENGAGKSTLGKVLSGVVRLDTGELLVDGKTTRHASPRAALRAGVAALSQEIALAPSLSVIDNVFLGSEVQRLGVVRSRELAARFDALTEETGFALSPHRKVSTLPLADQQKVELLRAIARRARVIVMDEPTAPLTLNEAQLLHRVVKRLQARGITIVYISHFLAEVLELADTVSVLRDGQLVSSRPAAEETSRTLIHGMLGRESTLEFPARTYTKGGRVRLSVRGLCTKAGLSDINLDVHAGEIVGLAGLIGSGRTELVRAIFGADKRASGQIEVDGEVVNPRSPREAIRAGMALLPESRKTQGLVMPLSTVSNISLSHMDDVARGGVVDGAAERATVRELMARLDVRAARPGAPVSSLSGGNQQKALFAKWLFRKPKVLIADEPTRGVDVGAKYAIYQVLRSLTDENMAVLIVSSELEEVMGLSDRVLAMRAGRLVAEFDGARVTQAEILSAAFGAKPESNAKGEA